MKKEEIYQKKIEYLESEIKRLKERGINAKEFYLKKIAKIFGEKATEVKKYMQGEEEKSYEKLLPFYENLYRISKDDLIKLLEKLQKLTDKK